MSAMLYEEKKERLLGKRKATRDKLGRPKVKNVSKQELHGMNTMVRKGEEVDETLPEAQRTQGIDSLT